MQLAAATVELYKQKAPELLDAVTSGESEHIMKRDPNTDYCVKFDAGWCGIHKTYGETFLGDACHFFPRATRDIGDNAVMTLAPSCPEALRLMLSVEDPFTYAPRDDARVPHAIKNYATDGTSSAAMMQIHDAFIAAVESAESAPRALSILASAVRSLAHMPRDQWPEIAPMALKFASGRLPAPEADMGDYPRLIAALRGLVAASKPTFRPRLDVVIENMQAAMAIGYDDASAQVILQESTLQTLYALEAMWRDASAAYDAPLKRMLQAQLSLAFFPFSGLGESLEDKITIIGVRFATARLALMCAHASADGVLSAEQMVDVWQPLSRFLDHLSDPTFSLAIYAELGWNREARLRALVGDG